MRAVFGVVSLLVVLAIVGMLASRQMKAVKTSVPAATSSAAAGAGAAPTVREQSQQIQQQVQSDVSKMLEQGARKEEADK